MKRERRGGWECLPGELIACILGRLQDDFKSISAVRGVCKHWNQSSLLLTALTPKPYPCNKHNKGCTCYNIDSPFNSCNKHKGCNCYDSWYLPCRKHKMHNIGCACYFNSLASFISNATSLRKLDLTSGGWPGNVPSEDILEACDWTSLHRTLNTLHAGRLDSERTSPLLSDCHALTELHIDSRSDCTLSFELELVARLRKLTIHGMIRNEWLTSIPLTNMEELYIWNFDLNKDKEGEDEHVTVTLKGPKLLKLQINLFVRLVNVEAPLLSSLEVTGRGHLHVSDACQCETVTIGPGILLVHAPECVKKLVIDDGMYGNMETLLSCRAVPWITSLCITFPGHAGWDVHDQDVTESFFKEVGSLAELQEIKVNTFFLSVLAGYVPSSLESFFPSLKDFTLDITISYAGNLDDVDEFVDAVVDTLKELKGLFGATVHMKMEQSSAVCVKREKLKEAVETLQTAVAALLSR